jgi:hypothetical protein
MRAVETTLNNLACYKGREFPPLSELTPIAERRSLSLALESAATHAQTGLLEMVPGLFIC